MKGARIGLIIFIAVVAVGAVSEFVIGRDPGAARTGLGLSDLFARRTVVTGLIGSEKAGFLENEEVQRILRSRHGIEVDFRRAGSFEMLESNPKGIDFLWPSSQVALEKYRQDFGPPLEAEIIFNSPIVMYAWRPVVESLSRAGYLETDGEITRARLDQMLAAIGAGRSWADVGVDATFGRFRIISTDPLQSNSGNMYMGLVANTLAGGVADATTLPRVLPDVLEAFQIQGQMEHSTGTLFERFLQLGAGQFPLIVGYESQYIELARANPDQWPQLSDQVRLIYPVPTVWSSHPLIALTEPGRELLNALEDEELQQIAWTEHGFRSGFIGIENNPADLGVTTVATDVTQVIQMPRPEVVFAIMDALESPGAQ